MKTNPNTTSRYDRLSQIETEIKKQNELLTRVNLLSNSSVIGEVISSLFTNQQQIIVEMLVIRKEIANLQNKVYQLEFPLS